MNKKQILKIIEKNVDINHFIVLQLIAQNDNLDEFWQYPKIRAYREALIKKNWIIEIKNSYFLTETGNTIYQDLKLENDDEVKAEDIEKNTIDPLASLAKNILEEIRTYLLQKTGNARLTLSHGAFACSERELTSRLYTYNKKFKTKDNEKIKVAILNYVKDIVEKKVPFPRKLKYFIFKEEKDEIVSDLQYYIENQNKKHKVEYDGGFNI